MEIKKYRYTEQEACIKLSALCASAEYCEYDLRRKMRNWLLCDNEDENEAVKNRVIARLRKDRFIDDERYARAFVRDKFRYNHWGVVRIKQELRLRKIDSNIIEDALTEIPKDDNLTMLRKLIATKKKSVKGKSEYDIRCKLIRFALGRGFQMDDIIKVVGDVDLE